MTRDKAIEASRLLAEGETPVLVDDREKTRAPWEEAGGIFIHHRSAAESIEELKELGILLD